ncbi:MAG: PHP domain-containing protein, partial [Cystobacterineae bacterium]|nr:PHP domain-containing protein [Cystobacterineae bacterium]
MLIDLHAHSYLTCGCSLNPKEVLARAELHGLDGVAFTEKNTQDGCEELLDLGKSSKIKVFVGMELDTDKGQYICFFENPLSAPEPVQMWGSNRERPWSIEECLPKLKSLGAVIIAARPFDAQFPYPAREHIQTLKCLCAIEVYNPSVSLGANEQAMEMAKKMRLPGIGGSDARNSLDEIGYAATLFEKPINTQRELVEALGEGAFWPIMMGELAKLVKPGAARAAEKTKKKKKKRRWGGGG